MAVAIALCLPGLLLCLNAVVWRGGTDLRDMPVARRFWETFAVASTQYLEDRSPTRFPPESVASWPGSAYRVELVPFVARQVGRQQIRPWEFWRTIRRNPPFKRNPLFHRSTEDVGRAALARFGFHVLKGIAPFLILWMGPLLAVPLLAWVVWEFHRVGRFTAGFVFAVLAACSPFFVEALTFHYTSAAFYPLALLPLLALAVFLILGPAPSLVALLARSLTFGSAFAVCALCRSSVVFFVVPALALLGAAVARGWRGWRARLTVGVVASALILGPYLLVRPRQHHDIWFSIWEGLGDFDREKGHMFSDAALLEHLRAAGATDVPSNRNITELDKDYTREVAFVRAEVLRDVRHDPLWYARILARRLVATVTEIKLMPRASVDGRSFRPATSENEGAMDVYWGFVITADWIGLGPWRAELPLAVLWLPLPLWVAWQVRREGWRSSAFVPVAAVAAAALTVPVLVTVAASFEPQSFVLVYALAAALLVDEAVRR